MEDNLFKDLFDLISKKERKIIIDDNPLIKNILGDVEVKDTKAPEVELQNLIVGLDEEYEPDEFIAVCNEYSKPCTASFKK